MGAAEVLSGDPEERNPQSAIAFESAAYGTEMSGCESGKVESNKHCMTLKRQLPANTGEECCVVGCKLRRWICQRSCWQHFILISNTHKREEKRKKK